MSLQLSLSVLVLVAVLAFVAFRLWRPLAVRALSQGDGGKAEAPPPAAPTQWESALKAQLRAIPKGKVIAFSVLAERIGLDVSVQTVSRQVRGYQYQTRMPWWRAVRKDGQRGTVPDSPLGQNQRERLELEGVIFEGMGFRYADYEWKV